MNYFTDCPEYISNSDLKLVRDVLIGKIDSSEFNEKRTIPDYYKFGSLLDAMITEPDKVGLNCYFDDSGAKINVFKEIYKKAERLRDVFYKSYPVYEFGNPEFKKQKEFYRTIKVNYKGFEFYHKARCKFDIYHPLKNSCDIKTTVCKTMNHFKEGFDFLDYDQQAAYYMDVARINEIYFIGLSKHNYNSFPIKIIRNDNIYNSGKRKYTRLAYEYQTMFNHLKLVS